MSPTIQVELLLTELEEISVGITTAGAAELEAVGILLARRESTLRQLSTALSGLGAEPWPARITARVERALETGDALTQQLGDVAAQTRNELRDIFRNRVLLQALAPVDTPAPVGIDCQG